MAPLGLRLRLAATSACVLVSLVASGWASAHGHGGQIVALFGVIALSALAWVERGAFTGLALLAAMDGIPFVDTTRSVASHVYAQDLAVLALGAAAVVWLVTDRSVGRSTRVVRLVRWCGIALLAWLALTIVRTAGNGDTTLLGAMSYGRDFLYFPLLLILLPSVRFSARDIKILVGVLAVGLCLFSVGQIMTITGVASPTYLVHTTVAPGSSRLLGLTRVYSPMNDLLIVGVVASIGALMLARSWTARLATLPIAAVVTTSFILELGRARWIGLAAGLLVVTLWLLFFGDPSITSLLRRRVIVFAGLLTGVGVAAVWTAPKAVVTGAFAQRLVSIFTDLASTRGTVQAREQVVGLLSHLVAGKWWTGLGLIPPSSHYYIGLPYGSLRDPDVGVMGALVTIGIIGAALIYLPVLVTLGQTLRRSPRQMATRFAWLRYSGAIWIAATLVSSITLVTLFSVGGLTMSAVIIAVLVQPSLWGRRESAQAEQPASERPPSSESQSFVPVGSP